MQARGPAEQSCLIFSPVSRNKANADLKTFRRRQKSGRPHPGRRLLIYPSRLPVLQQQTHGVDHDRANDSRAGVQQAECQPRTSSMHHDRDAGDQQ